MQPLLKFFFCLIPIYIFCFSQQSFANSSSVKAIEIEYGDNPFHPGSQSFILTTKKLSEFEIQIDFKQSYSTEVTQFLISEADLSKIGSCLGNIPSGRKLDANSIKKDTDPLDTHLSLKDKSNDGSNVLGYENGFCIFKVTILNNDNSVATNTWKSYEMENALKYIFKITKLKYRDLNALIGDILTYRMTTFQLEKTKRTNTPIEQHEK